MSGTVIKRVRINISLGDLKQGDVPLSTSEADDSSKSRYHHWWTVKNIPSWKVKVVQ